MWFRAILAVAVAAAAITISLCVAVPPSPAGLAGTRLTGGGRASCSLGEWSFLNGSNATEPPTVIYAWARVGDGPFVQMVVDTGATHPVISIDIARDSGVNYEERTVYLEMVGGSIPVHFAPTTRISVQERPGADFVNVHGRVLVSHHATSPHDPPSRNVQGTLSLTYVANHFWIDSRASRVFRANDPQQPVDVETAIRLQKHGGHALIDVLIAGRDKPLSLIVDSGAKCHLALRSAIATQVVADRKGTFGDEIEAWSGSTMRVRRLSLNSATSGGVNLHVDQCIAVDEDGGFDGADGSIGLSAFGGRVVLIDLENERLLLGHVRGR